MLSNVLPSFALNVPSISPERSASTVAAESLTILIVMFRACVLGPRQCGLGESWTPTSGLKLSSFHGPVPIGM